ncbi:MAG: hypothetical protein IJ809_02685 [Clostridia bacterium]|nr:hypothetical protein [Clostridia bacterium]
MSNKSVEKIEEAILPKINSLGYDLEYIEEVKENSRDILRVVIDKKDSSMSSEDCEKVSMAIGEDIDRCMKEKAYVLEVSSAGLEKNLKNIKLYEKYLGSKVYIKLFKKTKLTENLNEKEFEANIINVDKESEKITFKSEKGEQFTLELKDIAASHTVFDFNAFFKANENK